MTARIDVGTGTVGYLAAQRWLHAGRGGAEQAGAGRRARVLEARFPGRAGAVPAAR
jgi:hypothetical protein